MTKEQADFEVQRKDLRQHRWAPATAEAGDGEILVAVEKFALTANNITYAVFGDAMQYWNFFPTGPSQALWGRVPVWGYATVQQSRVPGIAEGERIYGYLPMSTHVVLKPEQVTPASFNDGAAHRKPLPGAYQQYRRLANDPMHVARFEDHRALLHPLYFTSFLIEDFLRASAHFGATQIVLASASSKTALGVAFLLKHHRSGKTPAVVGLTSPRNKAFCDKLGYYDQVVTYDALASLDPGTATVFVDMAGDGKLLASVHEHFKDALQYSCIVGATHWEQRATQHAMPGPKPQFFFAPTHMGVRIKQLGAEAFFARFGEAWQQFLPSVSRWLEVRHSRGRDAIATTWLEVLEGRAAPQLGHILTLANQ